MKDLSDKEIRSYVKKDEPYQCAGSYKYESHGSELFSEVKGASYTIQGLALTALLNAFEDLGVSFRK
jgi:predicted house-cleaning NTP pyrophosphatase (Maf/HAM1 superfamily)